MNPEPLRITSDNSILKPPMPGKPFSKMKFDELTEKEFFFRQVALIQSIRSMLIFFVIMTIINLVGLIAIVSKLLSL